MQSQIQTISIDILKNWASKNPNSAVTLKRALPMIGDNTRNSDYVMSTFKLIASPKGNWYTEELDPSGIVSFILWYRDPLYRTADKKLRRQLYTEALLDLQAELEQNITGTKWSRFRKRFVERLNTGNSTTATIKDRPAFEEFWASRLNVQLVKISTKTDAGKHISFVPSVETWTSDKPIIFVDENFESVFVAPDDGHERRTLYKWISDMDIAGWTIDWPIAEGSKDELDAAVIPILQFTTVPEKAKKAELAVIVGRYNAISHLREICCCDLDEES